MVLGLFLTVANLTNLPVIALFAIFIVLAIQLSPYARTIVVVINLKRTSNNLKPSAEPRLWESNQSGYDPRRFVGTLPQGYLLSQSARSIDGFGSTRLPRVPSRNLN